MFVESDHHLFYKPKLWYLFMCVCGHVLRLRQFDSIVLIGCRIAGCSAAKSPTEKFDYTLHVKNNKWHNVHVLLPTALSFCGLYTSVR